MINIPLPPTAIEFLRVASDEDFKEYYKKVVEEMLEWNIEVVSLIKQLSEVVYNVKP